MRLINTETLELEEFFGDRIPRYAILSHAWDALEISFQDYSWILNYEHELKDGIIDELPPKQRARVQGKCEALKKRTGYAKIQSFVSLARGFHTGAVDPESPYAREVRIGIPPVDYVWVDTCCINKESSAELSEAINSMHQWYHRAAFCVAYLADVSSGPLYGLTTQEMKSQSDLPHSRWFTRGWTLQELLVPRHVFFHNKDWASIALKDDMAELLEEITGIRRNVFTGPFRANVPSVATKMSWAARRETTRVEDEAYCLLGLFGVNMPLLYGEGERAFQRLQHEILRTSDDQSIFLWGYGLPLKDLEFQRIFAPSPREFRECAKMFPACQALPYLPMQKPCFMTNVGLHISLNLFRHAGGMYAVLPVQDADGWLLGIPLLGPGRVGHLRDVKDGAAVAKESHDQPLALFKADRLHAGNLIMRTLVIVQNWQLPQHVRPYATFQPDEFCLDLHCAKDIEVTEHYCPALRVSLRYSNAALCLRGLLELRTLTLPSFLARSVTGALYFRVRLSREMRQPSEEFVVKLNMDHTTGDLRKEGIWEWDSFRGPSMAPSMAALFLAGGEGAAGRTETTSRGITVSARSRWRALGRREDKFLCSVTLSHAKKNEVG
ncbi:hypothetical protein B0T18DRAFT_422585 [Schizothecium vesticola]|uniref:Heterokaryon incompatibility domain-containing protein n=1 Tax=Schizothecium vesticola TaxID=314040 RepID=A0AA40EHR7_9PEZI|nr:hypothetical protein B0T18DRAFT_422585 [Schizothecium vesticola]